MPSCRSGHVCINAQNQLGEQREKNTSGSTKDIAYADVLPDSARARNRCAPAPIRLLTSEPQVEANAIAIINGMPDTLRMMLAIASDRSPKMFHKRKNMNQVDRETKF